MTKIKQIKAYYFWFLPGSKFRFRRIDGVVEFKYSYGDWQTLFREYKILHKYYVG